MARAEYQLSVGNPQLTVSLERFTAAWVYVDNPTASWVYLHRGGTSLPTALNADFAIQPGTAKVLTVGGKDFAALLANPTAIPSTQTAGLAGASVVILFGDNTESPPSIGSLNYNSLGMSELQSTASWTTGASDIRYGPFDLETWGGFIVFVTQTSALPASVKAQYSDDAVTWYTAQTYALFQNLPTTIIFPRANRYARVALGSPATGVGATGTIQVRAIQEVITQAKYSTSSSGASSITYSLGNGISATQIIYTQGIPGIQFLFDGIASAGVINIVISGSQDGATYHTIQHFNLKCSQSAQQLWSIAQPPPYLAISVQNQTGGTIAAPLFYIPCDPEPESGLYLVNQILGTPTDAVGAGTLYGQLQSIAVNTAAPIIGNIGATTDVVNASYQGTVIAELHEILNALIQGGSLHGSIDSANATSVVGQLREAVAALGAGGSSAPGSLDAAQDVGNTNSSILGQLKNLTAVMGYGGQVAAAVDASGATSVIGQLRAIAGSFTTVNTNTGNTATNTLAIANATGTSADPSGTNSIIGKLKAIATDGSTTATQTTATNTNTSSIASSTAAISSATGTTGDSPSATTIIGYLNNIADILAYGASAKTTLDTSSGASLLASMRQTAALLGQIGNASAPDGAGATSILGQIKSIKTDADSIVTNTANIAQVSTNTTLRSDNAAASGTAVTVASTWTNTGTSLGASAYITGFNINHNFTSGGAATWVQIGIGFGTAGAFASTLGIGYIWTGTPFSLVVAGAGVRGINVGSNDRLWVFASSICTVGWTVFYTF